MLKINSLSIVLVISLSLLGQGLPQAAVRQNQPLVQKLINDLYNNPWMGPELEIPSPTSWEFNFTKPMKEILATGPAAQDALLAKLSDPQIEDQVIILLGGVGDEQAIGPIIDMMVDTIDPNAPGAGAKANRINECANLALTNITAASVIWGHGGGPLIEMCSKAKSCWSKWWVGNKATFKAGNIPSRNRQYAHYPNYGIYEQ